MRLSLTAHRPPFTPLPAPPCRSSNAPLPPQVWRNHAGLVEALLAAGADPDAADAESGWTALHRALHWGQLRCAAALLGANASLAQADWRGRSPLDLLSAELKEYLEPGEGDVFSWGNGANYTLGTGSADLQLFPARVDALHDRQVASVSAAKFHSAAVTVDGQLLTWGWGRGGRLGELGAGGGRAARRVDCGSLHCALLLCVQVKSALPLPPPTCSRSPARLLLSLCPDLLRFPALPRMQATPKLGSTAATAR